ncbi:hypothetical protein DW094_07485 [Ruminococcaceae bacterium AM07-15]|nr:hypothetical protein DW094_07485 [Ruminococcaceae bacterium AM07-15]
MSERYARLFALPENLYQPGSPVMILAGALLKDNQTGGILALMKFKNVGTKPIRGLKVRFFPQDLTGIDLDQPLEHQYLDLNAARDGEFGQKEPVAFPNAITRAFRVEVFQVVFADGTLWNQEQNQWAPMPPLQALETALGDKELCKEYQILYGANCRVMPQEDKGLWRCTCGAWNMESEANCHACGKNLDQLKALDMEQLKASRDARLTREQQAMAAQQAAQQAAASAPAQASSKGNRPQWLIPGIAALLVVLVGVGVFFANREKPASSGSSSSSGSGGGTQSAASDDSGTSAAADDSSSAASDDSGSASGSSGSVAASDEDFVRDALHDFSLEMEEYAPGTTVAFSLDGSSVTLGLLADQSQFTDDEIMGLANEILYGTGASDFLADGGFEIFFHLFLYDNDQQMKDLQDEMVDQGFTVLED